MNYWSRQQNIAVSQATMEIVELIRDGVMLRDWPLKNRKQLATALFPRRHTEVNGRWTEEAEAAKKLLAYAFRRSSYISLTNELSASIIDDAERTDLAIDAHYIRRELTGLIPKWSIEALLS